MNYFDTDVQYRVQTVKDIWMAIIISPTNLRRYLPCLWVSSKQCTMSAAVVWFIVITDG